MLDRGTDTTPPSEATRRLHTALTKLRDLLPRIFEPFKGIAGASSGLGLGLGLGLYIVDQFVRAHGGTAAAANDGDHVVLKLTIPRRPPGHFA